MRVLNAMVVPTFIYGCKAWTVQRRHENKMQACEMMFPRRVEGVTRLNKVKSEDVRKSLGQEVVMDIVKKKQRRRKVRMEQVYEGEVTRRRPRGRPRKQWSGNIK